MKLNKLLSICALALALTFGAGAAKADTPSVALVRDFYAQLLSAMKQGDQLGFAGRVKQLNPTIRAAYNMSLMTRFAVGTSWAGLSEEDRKHVTEAFASFSVATYASRFTKFDGEKFDVLGEKPAAGGGVMVETHLTPKDSEPVTLNYLVRNDESGKPRIVDVLLDASISELATRRSEFSAIVKRDGINALIGMLEEKAKKMGSSN